MRSGDGSGDGLNTASTIQAVTSGTGRHGNRASPGASPHVKGFAGVAIVRNTHAGRALCRNTTAGCDRALGSGKAPTAGTSQRRRGSWLDALVVRQRKTSRALRFIGIGP